MVCVWCSLGVTIYVLLTYVHGVTSCILTRYHVFSLALGLDQMIWSWLVFVSLTKIMKQEHGRNEEKSEKAWNKIMAIMSQSYLEMKIVQACILSLKAQWGHPSKYHWFLVFLVSTKSLLNQFGFFDVMLHTCPGASEIAFGNAEDEVTTAGVEEALLPLPQPPLPLPQQLAPVPNWPQGLLDMNWLTCELLSLVSLACPPCKTMELPCFFSMAVAIVLTW